MLDTAGLIDLETRLGAAQLPAARRGADQGRGRLGHRHRGQPLPRLPRRLLGGQPGPLPPEDPRRDGRAGEPPDPDLPRLPQRPARPLLRGARGADQLAQGAADEHRRRGGRDRDQGGPQVGLRGQGRARGPGRDHRLRRTTSTAAPSAIVCFSTDPDARGGFGPFLPGFRVVPFGDAEALEAAITPEHRRLPGRADPGRGRHHHPARRATSPASARSARRTASR